MSLFLFASFAHRLIHCKHLLIGFWEKERKSERNNFLSVCVCSKNQLDFAYMASLTKSLLLLCLSFFFPSRSCHASLTQVFVLSLFLAASCAAFVNIYARYNQQHWASLRAKNRSSQQLVWYVWAYNYRSDSSWPRFFVCSLGAKFWISLHLLSCCCCCWVSQLLTWAHHWQRQINWSRQRAVSRLFVSLSLTFSLSLLVARSLSSLLFFL